MKIFIEVLIGVASLCIYEWLSNITDEAKKEIENKKISRLNKK
ncbi:MAG: hypothetical protein ACOC5T_03975 [Elusimicrobiota bacterium]